MVIIIRNEITATINIKFGCKVMRWCCYDGDTGFLWRWWLVLVQRREFQQKRQACPWFILKVTRVTFSSVCPLVRCRAPPRDSNTKIMGWKALLADHLGDGQLRPNALFWASICIVLKTIRFRSSSIRIWKCSKRRNENRRPMIGFDCYLFWPISRNVDFRHLFLLLLIEIVLKSGVAFAIVCCL